MMVKTFFSGKYTVTVLGTSSGPYNNTYSSIAVGRLFMCSIKLLFKLFNISMSIKKRRIWIKG